MSATRLWYPRYVRDFKAKTGHLTLAEKGAYCALMDEYWERQGPLPGDDNALCRLIGAFPDEWAQVRENVLAFFKERDGKLYHKRIDEEIKNAAEKHAAKAERMAKARAKRWAESEQKKEQDADQDTDQIIDQNADQITSTHTQSQAQSHILTDTKSQVLGAAAPLEKPPSEAEQILDALCEVLSPETAADVVAFRKKIKSPLTLRGARGLANLYAKCRDGPEAAAEYHITSGYRGYQPDWQDNAKSNSKNRGQDAAGTVDLVWRLQREAEDRDRAGGEPLPDRKQIAVGR